MHNKATGVIYDMLAQALFRGRGLMGPIIISCLVSGSLYALVAAGLSLVSGALGVFNFAHGALLMMGAYTAWTVASSSALGAGIAAGVVASVVFMAIAGVVLYFLLVRSWSGKPGAELSVIMTTIAGGIFIENLFLTIYDGRLKVLDQIVVGAIHIAGTAIQYQDLLAILLAPALLGGLALLLTRNKTGLAVRAVAQNPDAVRLVGIGVERICLCRGYDRSVQFFLRRRLLDSRGAVRRSDRDPDRAADRSDGAGGVMGPSLRILTLAAVVAVALVAPRILAGSVAQNLAILSLLYAVVASNWDLTLRYSVSSISLMSPSSASPPMCPPSPR